MSGDNVLHNSTLLQWHPVILLGPYIPPNLKCREIRTLLTRLIFSFFGPHLVITFKPSPSVDSIENWTFHIPRVSAVFSLKWETNLIPRTSPLDPSLGKEPMERFWGRGWWETSILVPRAEILLASATYWELWQGAKQEKLWSARIADFWSTAPPQSLKTFGATLSFPIWFFCISFAHQNKSSWNLPNLSIRGVGQKARGSVAWVSGVPKGKRGRREAKGKERLTQTLLLEPSTPTQHDSIPSNQKHFR